ncbi:hypothetical protein DFH06DRAFT_1146131 [Mycena polygramma]|nr:hypothetical protein DFH06DRAFT_1146131 [Mycena polygramma]
MNNFDNHSLTLAPFVFPAHARTPIRPIQFLLHPSIPRPSNHHMVTSAPKEPIPSPVRTTTHPFSLCTILNPASVPTLESRDAPADELPENEPLFLPSALSPEAWEAGCTNGLLEMELLLRDAQCRTSLARYLNYKKLHARHQGTTTRARSIVHRNESKIRLHSEKYQAAWDALLANAGGDESKVGWKKLRKEDIRCMEDAEDLKKKEAKRQRAREKMKRKYQELLSHGEEPELMEEDNNEEDDGGGDASREQGRESRREVSWIWTAARSSGTDAGFEDALCIEWVKAYARSRRWTEEVKHLQAEFRRIPLSLEFVATLWEARGKNGMISYACKQSDLFRDLAARARATETAPKTPRGKRRVQPPVFDPLSMPMDDDVTTRCEREARDIDEEEEGNTMEEEEPEQLNMDDYEELVMGGEVDECGSGPVEATGIINIYGVQEPWEMVVVCRCGAEMIGDGTRDRPVVPENTRGNATAATSAPNPSQATCRHWEPWYYKLGEGMGGHGMNGDRRGSRQAARTLQRSRPAARLHQPWQVAAQKCARACHVTVTVRFLATFTPCARHFQAVSPAPGLTLAVLYTSELPPAQHLVDAHTLRAIRATGLLSKLGSCAISDARALIRMCMRWRTPTHRRRRPVSVLEYLACRRHRNPSPDPATFWFKFRSSSEQEGLMSSPSMLNSYICPRTVTVPLIEYTVGLLASCYALSRIPIPTPPFCISRSPYLTIWDTETPRGPSPAYLVSLPAVHASPGRSRSVSSNIHPHSQGVPVLRYKLVDPKQKQSAAISAAPAKLPISGWVWAQPKRKRKVLDYISPVCYIRATRLAISDDTSTDSDQSGRVGRLGGPEIFGMLGNPRSHRVITQRRLTVYFRLSVLIVHLSFCLILMFYFSFPFWSLAIVALGPS